VPGFITWPAVIQANARTSHPSGVYDLLPTVLEAIGVPHAHPDWATDGMSLLPLLRGDTAPGTPRPADKPLCFALGGQAACVDNQWKLVRDGAQGQCSWNDRSAGGKPEPPPYTDSKGKGTYLFDLASDPTESVPLNTAQAARYSAMVAYMDTWLKGVTSSQIHESTCMPPPAGPTPKPTPKPTPPTPPTPPPPPTPHFELQQASDPALCLSGGIISQHSKLIAAACDDGSGDEQWTTHGSDSTLWSTIDDTVAPKVDQEDFKKSSYCVVGNTVFFGKVSERDSNRFRVVPGNNGGSGGQAVVMLAHAHCSGMCIALNAAHTIELNYCNATTATSFVQAAQNSEGHLKGL
jgi:hypothetical protein